MPNLAIGDRVAYSAKFLRNIGAQTGELPELRGAIALIDTRASMTLAHVNWTDGTKSTANVANLAKVGSPDFSAN